MNPTESERSGAGAATDQVDYVEALARLLPEQGSNRGALLPLLHALQDEYGYIDDGLVPLIADALNLSRADVHGVITFYHDFRRSPPGRHRIKICRAESCRARGAIAVERAIVSAAGVAVGRSSADGSLTIDRIHCFGLCATGPNVMVDGRIRSRVDPMAIAELLDEVSA
ncbi:NAD(P)H-dependent oxidoreductase subunit E [Sphingomonas sp. GB1N7]|uniref:NAD(P)H-dependent oxidoreductase subunit E n=1 Tax=Parasphingomonas caseinilytica TaxID=3096158 RepID=UPI002FCBA20F